ncbi:hypothetical protein [Streptomyces sp. NPDC051776]|uniref:hypothetical protein n=1 Tax=Streptomyces sp. NPDC051776 TaxID=3155414 RepID=UPI003426E205
MRVRDTARRAGVLGHLLLVVVLAFSVFVMHTLGHPDEGSGPHEGPQAAHAAAAAGSMAVDARGSGESYDARPHLAGVMGARHAGTMGAHHSGVMGAHHSGAMGAHHSGVMGAAVTGPHHAAVTGAHRAAIRSAAPAAVQAPPLAGSAGVAAPPEANGPAGHGMDPSSVCVAVLGSLLIAGFVRVLLARRRPSRTAGPVRSAATSPAPRSPPPRAPSLAELSVLRM